MESEILTSINELRGKVLEMRADLDYVKEHVTEIKGTVDDVKKQLGEIKESSRAAQISEAKDI